MARAAGQALYRAAHPAWENALPRKRIVLRQGHHAAEADVVAAGTHFALSAGTQNIPGAVLFRAKIAATAMHTLLLGWFRRIIRFGWTLRVAYDRIFGVGFVRVWPVPVAAPLPHVSSDVI